MQYKTSSKYYRIEDAKFVRDVFNFYGKKEDTIEKEEIPEFIEKKIKSA